MRNLVIIAGDYRTFPLAVKYQSALFDENTDIIISVWSTSHCVNKLLGVELDITVTDKEIRGAITPYLNKANLIKIIIEDIRKFEFKKYNSAYIRRIQSAYNFVKKWVDAGKAEYKNVVMMRPDLCLTIRSNIWDIDVLPNEIHSSGFNTKSINRIEFPTILDWFLMCDLDTSIKLFCNQEFLNSWLNESDEIISADWHLWLAKYIMVAGLKIHYLSMIEKQMLVRHQGSANVEEDAIIWNYSMVLNHLRQHGLSQTLLYWSEDDIISGVSWLMNEKIGKL